jgi:magnesium-transporting ATPase (P-type)
LVVDTLPKDIMKEPPRNGEQILSKNMWLMLLTQSFLLGIGVILAIELPKNGIIPLNACNLNPAISYFVPNLPIKELLAQKARTMFITTLYIEETMFIWSFRRPNKSVFKSFKEDFSPILFTICLFTLALHALFVIFSYSANYYINIVMGLNLQINFMFLSITDWLICILFALPGLFGIEIFKSIARKRGIFF